MEFNPAHWHLIFNHLPIVGGMFASLILAYAIIRKNKSIIQLSYMLIVLCAITSIIASYTGEEAEHYIEGVMKVDKVILEEHVQAADIANYSMIAVGIISLLALFIAKIKDYKYTATIILILLLIVTAQMINVGNLGGDIMHTEIRGDNILP